MGADEHSCSQMKYPVMLKKPEMLFPICPVLPSHYYNLLLPVFR